MQKQKNKNMDDTNTTLNDMPTTEHPEVAWRSDEHVTELELSGLVLAGNSNSGSGWNRQT